MKDNASGRSIERRRFLGALASSTAAIGCGAAPHAVSRPPEPLAVPPAASGAGGDEWTRLRAEFALSPEWIHMAGFLLASHPTRVRQAIERHRQELDANPALYLEARFGDSSAILGPAARYMGVKPDEIALTDSTTMGLGTLYHGLALGVDDEVLTTTHDHYATHESLRLACERSGATLRKVPLYETGAAATAATMTAAIQAALTPRTRVVAITWVHSSTGVKTPVSQIARVIQTANAARPAERPILLCVDGVHGFGIEDVTMADLGCDFFVAGTHKWLFGPRGTGVIWGRADRWALLRPTIPHFGRAAYGAWMQDTPPPPTTADMMTPGGFHSFEHRWALGEAFEYHLALGKRKVQERIHELNRYCKEGLSKMSHVTLHTPLGSEVSSGIITFEVAGLNPKDVVKRLHEKRIVASDTPYAVSYARLAPGLFNSFAEIDQTLAEIGALA